MLAAVVALIAIIAYGWSWRWSGARLIETARGQIPLYETSLDAAVERFRYLPEFVALTEPVRMLLEQPSNAALAAEANAHLLNVARSASADVLFVMNAEGLTLASSNAGEPGSFVGQNYAFRPYFQSAIRSGAGRYYAVGATTGKPGYFLASRIDGADGVRGVAVVKVDLSPMEAEWRRTGEKVALVDAEGVVFLATEANWLYRPLAPLSTETQRALDETRKYGSPSRIGESLTRGTYFRGEMALTTFQLKDSPAEPLFELAHPMPGHGWQLLLFVPVTRANAFASLVATSVLVFGFVAFLLATVLRQRRAHVRARERARAELEVRVEERTLALRQAQDGLVQSAKLAGLGQGLAGIAHEIAQPLAALRISLASLKHFVESGERNRALASTSSVASIIERVEQLAGELRNFARPDTTRPRVVSLQELINGAISLVDHRFKALNVDLHRALPKAPVLVEARANRLEQVIVNLLTNALDAIEDANRTDARRRSITLRLAASTIRAELLVEDDGIGLGDEPSEKLFEPFVSTKANGRGLGLGLSISRGIMAEHGGELILQPAASGGTTARLTMPTASIGKPA